MFANKTVPNAFYPPAKTLKAGLEVSVSEGFDQSVVGALLEVD